MADKTILFGDEARAKLLHGAEILYRVVATTLGPRGRNGAVDKSSAGNFNNVSLLHDGVKLSKEVSLSDPTENLGVRLLREAAEKQVTSTGDGTSVVIVLAYHLLKESLKQVAAGVNPMSLIKPLQEDLTYCLYYLDQRAQPVKTLEEKIQIATISAEDAVLGKLIGETLDEVGTDGIVTVEESKGAETLVEHQKGMQFDKGYISPYFVTNPERMESTVEQPLILVTDYTIANFLDIVPFLNDKLGKVGSNNLVIIAEDVTGDALASFALNKARGVLNINCVRAPLFGDKQKAFLQDIALLTGGTFFSKELGFTWEKLEVEHLGRADRVTSTKDATLIVGGKGDTGQISDRVESLRTQLLNEESEFDAEKLKERIAKLTGGVAVIKVGGHTETEMRNRLEFCIDAVAATKAAIDEGIVPGGEIVYLELVDEVKSPIMKQALTKPFERLVENAGLNSGQLLERIQDEGPVQDWGINVIDGYLGDMVTAGIVDPVRVSKEALKNAVSTAINLMSVDVTIVQEPEVTK